MRFFWTKLKECQQSYQPERRKINFNNGCYAGFVHELKEQGGAKKILKENT